MNLQPNYNIYRANVKIKLPEIPKDERVIVKIKEVVFEATNISFNQINKHTQKREIIYARQLFHYLCKKFTPYTLNRIGSITNRTYDHSTIKHSVDKIEDILFLKNRSTNWVQVELAIRAMEDYTGKIILK